MKHITAILLSVMLLVGLCVPAAGAAESFRFTRENFPRMDGSTSMVPLGQGIASVLLGESRENTADLTGFQRTTQSFRNLALGDCDVVIAAEPKSDVFTDMDEQGFRYEIEAIAHEALVFVVNEDNPVTSLTREQVRDIYAGRITNWKEVGGEDLPIEAFQRNPSAGSQVMMEKLVMDGTAMMEAPSARIPQEMMALIQAVRSYDNSANAIGYTVFYYASDMQMARGLKILQIDGVLPSAQTIRSGAYPYVNGYYCCINADEPDGSPARRLYNWLVSDAGQSLLTLEGYVSIHAPGEAPSDGSDVLTDYSCYAPSGSASAVYTDFDCPKDHLEPSDAYGLLYPYVGSHLYGSYDVDMDDFAGGTMQGFFNAEGQRITDPVYSYLEQMLFDSGTPGHIWVLSKDGERYGFASDDGSIVSPMEYTSVWILGDYIMCTRNRQEGTFDLYDRSCQKVLDQEDFRIDGKQLIPFDCAGRIWICYPCDYNGATDYYLIDSNRNILMEIGTSCHVDERGRIIVHTDDWAEIAYDQNLNPIYFGDDTKVFNVMCLGNHLDSVQTLSMENIITDASGSLFAWDIQSSYNNLDGTYNIITNDTYRLYSADGTLLLDNVSTEWNYLGGQDLFYRQVGDSVELMRVSTGQTVTYPAGLYAAPIADCFFMPCEDNGTYYYRLINDDLTLGPRIDGRVSTETDLYSGEKYLIIAGSFGFAGESRLLTPDGKQELLRDNGTIHVMNGMYTVVDDWAFTCYNPDGSVLFCYPNYAFGSGD